MIHDVRFTDKVIRVPDDQVYMQINYDLCRSVDLLKLSIVLDRMVEAGMAPGMKEIMYKQAECLLAMMRTENNRLNGF